MAKISTFIIIDKEELTKFIKDYGPVLSKENQLALDPGYKIQHSDIEKGLITLSNNFVVKIDLDYIFTKVRKNKGLPDSLDLLEYQDLGEEIKIEFFGVG